MPDTPPSRLLAIILLAVIVVVGLLGVWLFPIAQGWVARQDCIALGRTDCG